MSKESVFRSILAVGLMAGKVFFTSKSFTKKSLVLRLTFLISSFVIFSLSFVLLSSVLWSLSATEGESSNVTLAIMYTYGTILVVYYILNGKKVTESFYSFRELIDLFDINISQTKSPFDEVIQKRVKKINWYIKLQFWYNFFLLPTDLLYKILCRIGLFEADNENQLIYAVGFDTSQVLFLPIIIFQTTALHLMIVIQTLNDLYIMNVTLLQILSFKYLRLKLANILHTVNDCQPLHLEGFDINTETSRFLHNSTNFEGNLKLKYDKRRQDNICLQVKMWIKNHVKLLRLSRDFIQLYTPVLLSYFGNMFLGISLGIFVITKGTTNFFSPFEKFIIASYFVGNTIGLLLMCIAGNYLMEESSRVFEDGFHAPWYECNRAVKTYLKVISIAARYPIRLTPHSSHILELSLETFNWMLKSMISFYIALTQVGAKMKVLNE